MSLMCLASGVPATVDSTWPAEPWVQVGLTWAWVHNGPAGCGNLCQSWPAEVWGLAHPPHPHQTHPGDPQSCPDPAPQTTEEEELLHAPHFRRAWTQLWDAWILPLPPPHSPTWCPHTPHSHKQQQPSPVKWYHPLFAGPWCYTLQRHCICLLDGFIIYDRPWMWQWWVSILPKCFLLTWQCDGDRCSSMLMDWRLSEHGTSLEQSSRFTTFCSLASQWYTTQPDPT